MVPNEAQYMKTPLVIFTIKEYNHLQYISKGILMILIDSFISRDMFGLSRIHSEILLAYSREILTSHSEHL